MKLPRNKWVLVGLAVLGVAIFIYVKRRNASSVNSSTGDVDETQLATDLGAQLTAALGGTPGATDPNALTSPDLLAFLEQLQAQDQSFLQDLQNLNNNGGGGGAGITPVSSAPPPTVQPTSVAPPPPPSSEPVQQQQMTNPYVNPYSTPTSVGVTNPGASTTTTPGATTSQNQPAGYNITGHGFV